MSFMDKVKKLVEEAPVASGGVNVNFGPMTVTPIIVDWENRQPDGKPGKTELAEYMRARGLKDSDPLELGSRESFQLLFDIDVTELNPALGFHYEREVEVKESNINERKPDKSVLTAWTEIVHPSLIAVFGANWYEKLLPNGKKAAPVVYVAAESVESPAPRKEGKKVATVPKFIASYKTLDECRAARDERYPPRDEEGTGVPVEEGDEDDGEFPEDVLEQVRTLYDSLRKNRKQTLKVLEGHPEFSEYEAEKLLDAALSEGEEE